MGKVLHDDVLDALLIEIADNGDRLFVCSAEPGTYTEASSTYMLASHNLTTGDGLGDFVIADDPSSGRRLTLAQQATIAITNTGTATHVAVCDAGNTKVLHVTTLSSSQALSSGNTVTVDPVYVTAQDPT